MSGVAETTLDEYLAMSEEERAALPKARQKKLAKLAQKAEQKALRTKAGGEGAAAAADQPNSAAGKKKEKADGDSKRVPPEYIDRTPKGEFKRLSETLAPAYYPPAVEAAWNDWWEARGFFGASTADALAADPGERFVMVIPPPNVTGSLHLGHALTCAIEDCVARWHRMRGATTLWLPGTDHAGIATQTVVEKKLMRERGVSRHDIGREAFLAEVWRYKDEYGGKICNQMRRLGASVDWSREQFTMNERLSRAVVEAFVRLHERGLIYRGTRLVNWCCSLRTALSDIEVDYVDVDGRTMRRVPGHEREVEFGVLVKFAYQVADGDGEEELVVATTRLETMLGDVAVAVHPDDARYRHLIGRRLVHPFVPEREMRVIADGELVDPEFGTGAVKVTPAHDPNDYECGQRHSLPQVTILDEQGRVAEAGGAEFCGMMRYDARAAVERALDARGLLRGKEPNAMRLGVCSRTGDVIEPMLKPQWWVDCRGMAARAVDKVRSGELRILPEFHRETWYRWLENIHDWCISRQLWWGHRVPAWRYVEAASGEERWVVARDEREARAKAPAGAQLRRDEDVLDTWFSSGLFPFSVFGWPDAESDELRAFYPGTLLETGHDILFFWVARMVMLGLELTDRLPFHTVYLHAIVRDKYGRKMSKSLGNVVDPLEMIEGATLAQMHEKLYAGNLDPREVERAKEGQRLDFGEGGIPECGADALRFGLLAYTLQGRDVNLDVARVAAYRNFCNKLWNAVRFALSKDADAGADDGHYGGGGSDDDGRPLKLEDRWILSRLARCAATCNASLASFAFAEAVSALYNFWLYELCDVYLEAIKPRMASGDAPHTLLRCLDAGLRLMHPMMPFVTEELYQRLPVANRSESIMVAPYPDVGRQFDEEAERRMDDALAAVKCIRSLRASYDVKRSARPRVYLVVAAREDGPAADARDLTEVVRVLAGCGSVTAMANGAAADVIDTASCAVTVVSASLSVYLDLAGVVDFDAELAKLEAKAAEARQRSRRHADKMQMDGYEHKVPERVRMKTVEQRDAAERELATVTEAMGRLAALRDASAA